MKSEPSEESSLETECLFGETVDILEEYLDWVYCRLNTDNYRIPPTRRTKHEEPRTTNQAPGTWDKA